MGARFGGTEPEPEGAGRWRWWRPQWRWRNQRQRWRLEADRREDPKEPPSSRTTAEPASSSAASSARRRCTARRRGGDVRRPLGARSQRGSGTPAVDRAIRQPTPASSGQAAAISGWPRNRPSTRPPEAFADDLMPDPRIQRFGDMRLGDLDAAGPQPLRTMWRVARDRLGSRYGEMTIGEIIDRYRGGDGGGVSAGA